jgi:flagellar assembly protein FliH
MSSPEPLRFASWPVPELRLVPATVVAEPDEPTAEALAYARGLEDGRREAADEAERRLGGARTAMAGAAAALEHERATFARRGEESLYAIATALAQRLLQRELALDPTVVRDLVRRALEAVPLEGTLEVRVHPADLAALGHDLELYAPGGRRLELRWVPDPGIGRGGFMIETPLRVVDGRVEKVLEAALERLLHG